jgi:hypothetical protein
MGSRLTISFARASELLTYNRKTGIIRRRSSGKVFGGPDGSGYLRAILDGQVFKAHRIAWLLATGSMPASEIDHKNGVRDDNRFSNLREATPQQQVQNRCLRSDNKAGATGVSWDRNKRKWMAQLRLNGAMIFHGCFDSKNRAISAYRQARERSHAFQPHPREA